jgi:hypothetical protein
MLGSLAVLGHDPSLCMLCHWSWLLFSVFSVTTFVGNWLFPKLEAWLLFWTLPMLHGLLWLQAVLIAFAGVWPGTLWAGVSAHSGSRLLMAQLGSAPLLLLPLAAMLAYMWVERAYLLVIFYDFRSQLLPEHRKWNLLWHLCSPAVPLAGWAYFFNPSVFTDLPRWPGALPVVLVCALSNGPLLYYCHQQTTNYVGTVRSRRPRARAPQRNAPDPSQDRARARRRYAGCLARGWSGVNQTVGGCETDRVCERRRPRRCTVCESSERVHAAPPSDFRGRCRVRGRRRSRSDTPAVRTWSACYRGSGVSAQWSLFQPANSERIVPGTNRAGVPARPAIRSTASGLPTQRGPNSPSDAPSDLFCVGSLGDIWLHSPCRYLVSK